MLNLLFNGGGKAKMIFALICILAGILVFVFFDELRDKRVSVLGVEVLHYCTQTFGRIGFSCFYIIGGAIIGLWGFFDYRRKQRENQNIHNNPNNQFGGYR